MTKRIGILISGGGSNMVSLVNALKLNDLAECCVVVSNDPTAKGLERAAALGIATASVDHKTFDKDRLGFEAALSACLADYNLDVLCLAGFMRVLSGEFVRDWEGRILNIHPSLLPKYKGLHTHERALEAGDAEAGCSVHLVTAELDDGPILGQARVPIVTGDSAETIAARVLVKEHLLYPLVLERFLSGNVDRIDI